MKHCVRLDAWTSSPTTVLHPLYADDVLLLASGSTTELASWRASVSAAAVVHRIEGLGLEVAPQKTNTALFYGGRRVVFPVDISILGRNITTADSIKYLGIIFDRRLNFK